MDSFEAAAERARRRVETLRDQDDEAGADSLEAEIDYWSDVLTAPAASSILPALS